MFGVIRTKFCDNLALSDDSLTKCYAQNICLKVSAASSLIPSSPRQGQQFSGRYKILHVSPILPPSSTVIVTNGHLQYLTLVLNSEPKWASLHRRLRSFQSRACLVAVLTLSFSSGTSNTRPTRILNLSEHPKYHSLLPQDFRLHWATKRL